MLYSAYTAAALSLLLVALSVNVSRVRMAHGIGLGDGGVKDLTLAIRAHGNSVEQSLIFVLLLYFVEVNRYAEPRIALALGSVFVLTRIVYCTAMLKRILVIRQIAYVVTLLLQVATAAIILGH